MATLVIDGRGKRLQLEQRTVQVSSAEGGSRRIPIALLDRVVIHAAAMVSTSLLAALARAGVPVVIVPGGRADRASASIGIHGKDAARRLIQYEKAADRQWCARWSRRLLRAKLRSEEWLLRRGASSRATLRGPLLRAAQQLRQLRRRLEESNEGPAQLLGYEGTAARVYFAAFATLFPPSLGFHERNRRPPRDAVNACLSLGYTLVHYQMVATTAAAGLDPYVGFYHRPEHGRESLAADLIETERTRIDALVQRLFGERRLRKEHFSHRDGACLLGRAGRKTFYEAYEAITPSLMRHQRRLCRLVVRALTGEDDGTWITTEEAALH